MPEPTIRMPFITITHRTPVVLPDSHEAQLSEWPEKWTDEHLVGTVHRQYCGRTPVKYGVDPHIFRLYDDDSGFEPIEYFGSAYGCTEVRYYSPFEPADPNGLDNASNWDTL